MSTYYKILPEDLICRGFQYHEGLNIDTNTIDKNESGYGLSFSDAKHILHSCSSGSMIAKVEIPNDAIVYHFNDKSKADRIILKNIRPLWSVETIEDLIREGVEFKSCRICVIYEALKNDYSDVAKYLIEQSTGIHNYTLCHACVFGSLDVVKCLVEHGADIHADNDHALRVASDYGHLEIVEYLVEQGADIHADADYALRIASENGYLDIVKCLVEHGANIHACDDYAIQYAGTPEIEEYLKSLRFSIMNVARKSEATRGGV